MPILEIRERSLNFILTPAYSVSDKGPHDRLKPFMVFQPDPVDFNSWHNLSQAFTEKQMSYPRLTATVQIKIMQNRATQDVKGLVLLWHFIHHFHQANLVSIFHSTVTSKS